MDPRVGQEGYGLVGMDSETSGRQSSRERPLASVLGSLQPLSYTQMTLTLNAGLQEAV